MRHSPDAESISGNAHLAANFEYWCTQFRLRQGERYRSSAERDRFMA